MCVSGSQRIDNLFAMEPAVLDENLAGVLTANHHAGQVKSRHIALKRLGIEGRLACFWIEANSKTLDERKVWVVSRQRKYLACGDSALPRTIFNNYVIRFNLYDMRLRKRANLVGTNAILDIRTHPVLQALADCRATVHQSYLCPAPE